MYLKILPIFILLFFFVQPAEAVVQLPSELNTEEVVAQSMTKKELRQQRRMERRVDRWERRAERRTKGDGSILAYVGLVLGIIGVIASIIMIVIGGSSFLMIGALLVITAGLAFIMSFLDSPERWRAVLGFWLVMVGTVIPLFFLIVEFFFCC